MGQAATGELWTVITFAATATWKRAIPLLVAATHSPLATKGHLVMAAGGDLNERASGHVGLAKFVGTQHASRGVHRAKIDSVPTDQRSYSVCRVGQGESLKPESIR